MNDPIDTPRRQLGELGALAHRTQEDERRILAAAEKRLEEVERTIENTRTIPSLHGDSEAAETYMNAIEERGRLHQVIAQARAHLEPDS
jgi:hypothetical protein